MKEESDGLAKGLEYPGNQVELMILPMLVWLMVVLLKLEYGMMME